MPEPQTVAIIAGLLVPVLILLIGYVHRREGKLRKYYHVRWKKSSSLLATDVLGVRGEPEHGFDEYYLPRGEDTVAIERLKAGGNLLVLGLPLSGKSRTVYEALKTLREKCDVIIPRVRDVDTEDFLIPRHLSWWRTPILLLDDLNKYSDKQDFMYLLRKFLQRKVTVVATCRRGEEYERVRAAMEAELTSIFGAPVQLGTISRADAEQVKRRTNRPVPRRFDGNIGSIFLDLAAMRERFVRCEDAEKRLLRSVARLYYAGLSGERDTFSVDRTQRVCAQLEGLELNAGDWTDALGTLENQGFLRAAADQLWAEEAYLEFALDERLRGLDGLREMVGVFSHDAEALFTVASRALATAPSSRLKAAYSRLAVDGYRRVLQTWMLDPHPRWYAATQNNLGSAYGTLAEVEEKGENCRRAIESYEEALRVRTLEDFPTDYGMTQYNLGNAYRKLAEVEEKGQSCRRAIEAFKEALRVYTLEDFPMHYAMTQASLGTAYKTLAGVEEKGENCRRAFEAFKEALRVYTLEDFPMDYGKTQNNLGNAYSTLAEVEKKTENCRRAIEAYEEALTVFTLEDIPMDYGKAQCNLGNAYGKLAQVEDKAGNCKRAVAAYHQALEVYTEDEFPELHRMVVGNLKYTLETVCAGEGLD